jgi:hypothetical protein
MANLHVYVGLENVNLTDPQRGQMYAAVKALQVPNQNRPCFINHERLRLDNNAGIWEALFDESWLTIAAFRQYIANVFGVPVGDITNTTSSQSFGGGTTFIVTLRYQAQNRMRAALFGGANATYAQSHAEVLGYLALNKALWEP